MSFLNKYKYKNWKKPTPSSILEYLHTPCSNSTRIANFIFQKIIGLNRKQQFMIHFTSTVTGRIDLGRNVANSFATSGGCYIQARNGVRIGDNTIFAPGVRIISSNHDPKDTTKHIESSQVEIGENCWLAANVIIMPGVVLGNGVVVGAGSVVTKSFPNSVLIAGVPAKIIRDLNQ